MNRGSLLKGGLPARLGLVVVLALAVVGLTKACTRGGGDGVEDAHAHRHRDDHGPSACSKGGAARGDNHGDAAVPGCSAGGGDGGDSSHGHGDHHGGDHHEEGHHDEVTLTDAAIAANGIEIARVERQVLRPTLDVPARVIFDPDAVAHVGSPLSGRVIELKATVGETVSKGDVLAVIESPELGAIQGEYLEQRSAVETSAPIVELAKSTYERARRLSESEAVSRTEVEKREIEYKTAQADYRAALSATAALESKLRIFGFDRQTMDSLVESAEISPHYPIRAPISGRVIEREVTLGELVKPEDESLFVLGDPGRPWVIADVPESRAAEVVAGAKARIAASLGERSDVEGSVAYVSPLVDSATRTVPVRIVPGRQQGKLRPGMFTRASVALRRGGGDPTPTLAIPETAVQTIEGRPVVFVPVKGERNTFAKRNVTVGSPVGGMVPLFSGLREGDRVVISGSFILKADLGKEGAAHEH